MEIGNIITIISNNKLFKFKILRINSDSIIFEMMNDDEIFDPGQITFDLFKKPLGGSLVPSDGVFIKDTFTVPVDMINRKSMIFALSTSGTVQFKRSRTPTTTSLYGSYISPVLVVAKSQKNNIYFIIFR